MLVVFHCWTIRSVCGVPAEQRQKRNWVITSVQKTAGGSLHPKRSVQGFDVWQKKLSWQTNRTVVLAVLIVLLSMRLYELGCSYLCVLFFFFALLIVKLWKLPRHKTSWGLVKKTTIFNSGAACCRFCTFIQKPNNWVRMNFPLFHDGTSKLLIAKYEIKQN